MNWKLNILHDILLSTFSPFSCGEVPLYVIEVLVQMQEVETLVGRHIQKLIVRQTWLSLTSAANLRILVLLKRNAIQLKA